MVVALWWLLRGIQSLRQKIDPVEHARIDPNAKCPACGHRKGSIKFVLDIKREGHVEHSCELCQAKWYEPTLVKSEKWIARQQVAQ